MVYSSLKGALPAKERCRSFSLKGKYHGNSHVEAMTNVIQAHCLQTNLKRRYYLCGKFTREHFARAVICSVEFAHDVMFFSPISSKCHRLPSTRPVVNPKVFVRGKMVANQKVVHAKQAVFYAIKEKQIQIIFFRRNEIGNFQPCLQHTPTTLISPGKADATQNRRPIPFKNVHVWWILLVKQTRLLDQHQNNLLSLFASCNSRE